MEMTKRRREFLDTIILLYKKTGEPVHYEEVAECLGVSKWTAYDVIQALAKEQRVRIEYLTRGFGQVGRSRIGVVPSKVRLSMPSQADLTTAKRELSAMLNEVSENLKQATVERLLARVKTSKSRELACVYFIGLILFVLKNTTEISAAYLLQSVISNVNMEVGLFAGVGVVIGVLLKAGIPKEQVEQFREQLVTLQESLREITEDEQKRLQAFWQEAITDLPAES